MPYKFITAYIRYIHGQCYFAQSEYIHVLCAKQSSFSHCQLPFRTRGTGCSRPSSQPLIFVTSCLSSLGRYLVQPYRRRLKTIAEVLYTDLLICRILVFMLSTIICSMPSVTYNCHAPNTSPLSFAALSTPGNLITMFRARIRPCAGFLAPFESFILSIKIVWSKKNAFSINWNMEYLGKFLKNCKIKIK